MTSIKVCRDPSLSGMCSGEDEYLNWGSDISDQLLSTEEAALERGRIELDKQFSNRRDCNLALHQTTFMQPGVIIATMNVDAIEKGRLSRLSINVQRSGDSLIVGSDVSMEKNI